MRTVYFNNTTCSQPYATVQNCRHTINARSLLSVDAFIIFNCSRLDTARRRCNVYFLYEGIFFHNKTCSHSFGAVRNCRHTANARSKHSVDVFIIWNGSRLNTASRRCRVYFLYENIICLITQPGRSHMEPYRLAGTQSMLEASSA